MRWMLLIVTVLIFVFALRSSPGWMAVGLLTGIVMCFVTVLAFAAKRIEARAQSEVYVPTPEELALLKRRAERQKAAHAARGGRAAGIDGQQPSQR
jgi:hypothetical protein